MTIPNLPTDNLYKFTALSGVILIIFSLYYPREKLYETRLKIIDVGYKMKVLEAKRRIISKSIDENSRELKSFNRELNKIFEKIENRKIKGEDSKTIISDLKKKRSYHLKKHLKADHKLAELELYGLKILKLQKETEMLNDIYVSRAFISIFINIFGIIMAFIGFKLWYTRVQKCIDRTLKDTTENVSSE